MLIKEQDTIINEVYYCKVFYASSDHYASVFLRRINRLIYTWEYLDSDYKDQGVFTGTVIQCFELTPNQKADLIIRALNRIDNYGK